MNEFLQEPMNMYAVAFAVFVVLAYVLGRKPIVAWIDGEIAKIIAELNTARELRAEAEAALADVKAKQEKAERDVQVILKMAKQQAEAMRKQADDDIATLVQRHHQMAKERIQVAQDRAITAVRQAAITMGMDMARKNLTENLSDADAAKLVEQAMDDIPAIKSKAKV